jgi:hypothetical protein
VLRGAERRHADALSPEVRDPGDVVRGEQLEAAWMDASQHADRLTRVHERDARGQIDDREIQLAARQQLSVRGPAANVNVVDVREALGVEQVFRHVAGRDTDARDLRQAERECFGRPLIGE